MKLFFVKYDDVIEIRGRMEGDGIVGDYQKELTPGKSAFGVSYEELAKYNGGSIEISEGGKYQIHAE